MAQPLTSKMYLLLGFTFIFLISMIFHQNLKQCFRPVIPMIVSTTAIQSVSDIQKTTDKILLQINQRIPRINITNKSITTSAKNSQVHLKNPKDRYCVGDHLTVQVDMFDYLGNRKTYGGDFLRARISTPELEAGSSGRIEDFNNGTYHVHFILFWEGKVNVDVLLMHPSEGASAIWTYRNKWHGYVDHSGKYTRPQGQSEVECGFHLNKKQKLCEYKDLRDEEYFYCIKPENFSCESLSEVRSWWRKDRTLLTTTEKSLFDQFFKECTFCVDYCFAHSWHFLDELQEVVTGNGLPTVLKKFPEMLSTCWPFCLHSVVQLTPNHLDWVQVW
ncbi:NXPE family member 4-like [Anomaloglossus baeobatrachus]